MTKLEEMLEIAYMAGIKRSIIQRGLDANDLENVLEDFALFIENLQKGFENHYEVNQIEESPLQALHDYLEDKFSVLNIGNTIKQFWVQ